jgi:hypothetical protein
MQNRLKQNSRQIIQPIFIDAGRYSGEARQVQRLEIQEKPVDPR